MTTIIHRRPARQHGPPPPTGEIALQEPPELPEPQKASIGSALMMLPMALGMGASGLMMLTRGGGGASSALMPAMMGGSMVGMALMGVLRGGGDRKRELNGDRRDYMRYLAQTRRKVRQAAQAQREAQLWRHPAPDALGDYIAADRMWERRSSDDDFGHVRIGTGTQRLGLSLQPPQTRPVEDLEPLATISLRRFIEVHHSVAALPVSLSLRSFSSVLLRGHGTPVDALARAMICQVAAFHSPNDLRIAVCAARERQHNWEWMKWLPHATHPTEHDAAGSVRLFTDNVADLQQLLGGDKFADRDRFEPNTPPPSGEPTVVVFLDGVSIPTGSRFSTNGYNGTVVVDVGGTLVPTDRKLTLELEVTDDDMFVIAADDDTEPRSIGAPDALTIAGSRRFARTLAPYRPPSTAVESDEPLSTDIELSDLLGIRDPRSFDPVAMWAERTTRDKMRIPLGIKDDGSPIEIDIKEAAQGGSGPHGMLVGATGSGKSELLRTLVVALACTHSSDTLNFVLVDFKGGATFLGLESLPHTSAIITNLADELSMVDRMQDAIQGELVRRQEFLRAAGQPSLHDYERARLGGAELPPFPSLFLVIDEFSELLTAKREFLDLFVMVGRLGRSLGVHLLLSTQRLDEGRISELSSHLSYRIGLKMFSSGESRSVLGITAAYDQPLPPGGGFLKTDKNSIEPFRAAYISAPQPERTAPTTPQSIAAVAGEIVPFTPEYIAPATPISDHDEPAVASEPDPVAASTPADGDLPSLMEVLVDRLSGSCAPAHRIWLPPLEVSPPINDLIQEIDATNDPLPMPNGSRRHLYAPIGYIDKPAEQRWDFLAANLGGAGGNVGIGGGPQSGKSTLLRTLILSLAVSHRPSAVQFYCLDFGGGSLATLRELPHVGGIAGRLDRERVERTVKEMANLLTQRETLFADSGIDSMADYRSRRRRGEFADQVYGDDVFLVIDGWFTMRDEFDGLESSLQQLAQRGLAFGLHIVVATTRWADVRPWLRDNLGTKFELRLGDAIDSVINSRAAATVPARPGRGLTMSKEHFLVGLPRLDASSAIDDLSDAARAAAQRVSATWPDERAPAIAMVPKVLNAADLPPAEGDGTRTTDLVVPIGLCTDDMQPIRHNFGAHPHLIVVGDDESGKTNLLRLVANAIVRQIPSDAGQIVLADYRRQLYDSVPEDYRLAYASAAAALKTSVEQMAITLAKRVPGPEITPDRLKLRDWWEGRELFILVDDYDLVASGYDSPLAPLVDLLPAGADIGLHLIVARGAAGAGRAMNESVIRRLLELGTPTVLLSCPREEGSFGNTRAENLPPGRARYITRRRARPLQTGFLDIEASAELADAQAAT